MSASHFNTVALIAGAAVSGLLLLKLWQADRRLLAAKREVRSVWLRLGKGLGFREFLASKKPKHAITPPVTTVLCRCGG